MHVGARSQPVGGNSLCLCASLGSTSVSQAWWQAPIATEASPSTVIHIFKVLCVMTSSENYLDPSRWSHAALVNQFCFLLLIPLQLLCSNGYNMIIMKVTMLASGFLLRKSLKAPCIYVNIKSGNTKNIPHLT